MTPQTFKLDYLQDQQVCYIFIYNINLLYICVIDIKKLSLYRWCVYVCVHVCATHTWPHSVRVCVCVY